jgi:hypothetical protein
MRSSNPPVSCISIPNEFHFSFFLLRNQKGKKKKKNETKCGKGFLGAVRIIKIAFVPVPDIFPSI